MEGSAEERRAAGRALRATVPRSAHAEWSPPPGRPDPFDVLERQASSRVPELAPIRYARMAESPFAFFRGAAAVMATDLATTPATGIRVQACGDAHVDNFGLFASPERNLVFDINDFDETIPGPWEWDVKRLCASLHVVARQRGFSRAACDGVVLAAARSYRERVTQYSSWRVLDLWYERTEIKEVIEHFPKRYRSHVRRDVKRARRKDHLRAVGKLTEVVDGRRRFIEDPPLIVHVGDTEYDDDDVAGVIASYRANLSDDRRHMFDRYRAAGRGTEGRRGRERGDAVLGGAPRGSGRSRARSHRVAGQGGAALRVGAVRRSLAVRASGRAGRRRPAPHPGRGRRLPELDGGPEERSPLLRAPALGLQGAGRPHGHGPRPPAPSRCALCLDPRPLARADGRCASRSRATSARHRRSTTPSPRSPAGTR